MMQQLFRANGRLLFWLLLAIFLGLGLQQLLPVTARQQEDQPVISEFLAANGAGLTDELGQTVDWIEIHNPSLTPLNLAGFALTDDAANPEKWTFPDVTLPGGGYLLLFASGQDKKVANSPLHTNFRLNSNGEFLGLYNILDGQMVTAIAPAPQLRDIAFGRVAGQPGYRYLANPTPGQPNDASQSWPGKVNPVTFSARRGFYHAPFTLTLSTATPEAVIRYTLDGSAPSPERGLIYDDGPLAIDRTTFVRAIAFKPNFLPADVETHTYLFPDTILRQPANPAGYPDNWGQQPITFANFKAGEPVTADYEMDPTIVDDARFRPLLEAGLTDIPSLSIVTAVQNFQIYANPRGKGRNWERPASVELIDPTGAGSGFQINAGVRIQGGAGRWEFMPKHSLRLFFRSQYGPARLEYPLFAHSPVESFDTLVLRGGVDRSYAGHPEQINHSLATYSRDEWLRASQIDISGAGSHGIFVHLYINGLYWGLYNLVERPDSAFMAAYFGGDEDSWFVANHSGAIAGSSERFRAMLALARAGGLADSEMYATMASHLDIPQFIDYVILNWYAGNQDWPHNNWYASVQLPAGQTRYFVWDGEDIWGSGAEIRLGRTNVPGLENTVRPLLEALLKNSDFKMELADRLYHHLYHDDGALTAANAQTRWLAINRPLERAITAESARWGDTRQEPPLTRDDWLAAVDNVTAQMADNPGKLIGLAREQGYYPPLDPPRFSRSGGPIEPGATLTMSAQADIYFTTDGSDPRQANSGELNPAARRYRSNVDQPLALTQTTHLKARSRAGSTWSALNQAVFSLTAVQHPLRITEIMYHPPGATNSEFIELQNIGSRTLNLSGFTFEEGIRFTFPANSTLAPGQTLVLAGDAETFATQYPGALAAGEFQGQLSNRGETVTLRDAAGEVVATVTYGDDNGWPISPDGRGDSLVLHNLAGDPNDPKSWRASANLYGSPGVTNFNERD